MKKQPKTDADFAEIVNRESLNTINRMGIIIDKMQKKIKEQENKIKELESEIQSNKGETQ